MAEHIRAEEMALEKGAVAVDDAKQQVQQRIRAIENEMAQLSSFWTGDAATAYNSLMVNWQDKATRLNNILIELSQSLRATANVQAQNEADSQSKTSRLQSLLG